MGRTRGRTTHLEGGKDSLKDKASSDGFLENGGHLIENSQTQLRSPETVNDLIASAMKVAGVVLMVSMAAVPPISHTECSADILLSSLRHDLIPQEELSLFDLNINQNPTCHDVVDFSVSNLFQALDLELVHKEELGFVGFAADLDAWHTDKKGSPVFYFFEKLKSVKHALTKLHREDYSNLSLKVKYAKENITAFQAKLLQDPVSELLINEEKLKIKKFTSLTLKNAGINMLNQRAKIKHIQESDCSSKYFFAKIYARRHQQYVGAIQDIHGNLRTDPDSVKHAFQNYYKDLEKTF
ncbi:hypothetical protein KSS87_021162, partial [Heliosperma pusillum]